MAVENWLDDVAKLARSVTFNGREVRAFLLHGKREFPASLSDSDFPCALTLIKGVKGTYSYGPSLEYTHGQTEFHLTKGLDLALYPELVAAITKARNAFLPAGRNLGGKVASIDFDAGVENNIEGPVRLKMGSEAEHFGIIVHWVVKESVSGEITI